MLIRTFGVMGQEALKHSLLRYGNVGLLRDVWEKGLSKVLTRVGEMNLSAEAMLAQGKAMR